MLQLAAAPPISPQAQRRPPLQSAMQSIALPCRRPEARAPAINGPPLAQWPDRVAVVAYGYHKAGLVDCMADEDWQTEVDPDQPWDGMRAASPADLMNWATANGVWMPKFQKCRVLSLSRR